MTDIRRRLEAARSENADLRRQLRAQREGVSLGVVSAELLEELTTLHHLAHYGCRRPDDLGGTISHSRGRTPGNNSQAYREWQRVQYRLGRLEQELRTMNNHLDSERASRASSQTDSTPSRPHRYAESATLSDPVCYTYPHAPRVRPR